MQDKFSTIRGYSERFNCFQTLKKGKYAPEFLVHAAFIACEHIINHC